MAAVPGLHDDIAHVLAAEVGKAFDGLTDEDDQEALADVARAMQDIGIA